jgi:mycothiol S-conjugate amidase
VPDSRLSILTVHAHPDDEASKGSATIARYSEEGIRTSLVCCTGGEEGEVLNPAMDRPEVQDNLAKVRSDELAESARVIGYDTVHLLGYRDSGMPDTPANARAEAFANADLDEAVGRLVAIIRSERPQVIVTYSDDQQGYQHPDHIRVNDISVPAFEAAGDPDAYPEAGEPWTPLKLYYTVWSRARIQALHEKYQELDIESPYNEWWFSRPSNDGKITTKVEIGDWFDRRTKALLAHATQVDPESKFWFGLPDDVARHVYPYDDYALAISRVPSSIPEDDLFAGIRQNATI